MSFFDRIFGRKISSTNSDAEPAPGEPALPLASNPVAFHGRDEDSHASEESVTEAIASLSQAPGDATLALLSDPPQVGGEVVVTKKEHTDWQGLPDLGVAPDSLPSAFVSLPISPESSVRELALLRIAISIREVLTKRLFQDLASSKLEIAHLCGETMDRMQIEYPAAATSRMVNVEGQAESIVNPGSDLSRIDPTSDSLPSGPVQGEMTHIEQLKLRIEELERENAEFRSKEREELGRLRFDLRQQQRIVEEKERLEKLIQESDLKSMRLAEREATVNKNFSELQRREQLLAGQNSVRNDAASKGGVALMEEVKRLRAQIASGSSPANEREASLVKELRILRERVNSDANTAYKKQMEMQEQLDQADRSIQKLLKEKNELEKPQKTEIRRALPPQKMTKREPNFDDTLIAVSDQRIVDWMLDDASPEQAGVDHGYLCLTGEGPWSDQQIRELMDDAGFSLWRLPDADVEHVVVGRYSWDGAALEQQIEFMEGRQLRIYSQEMWFAKLATGRDPFDSGDHDLLMAFAKGHPALEYLIDRDSPWPEVSSGELVIGDGVFTEGIEFGANSPLHNFGYQVGVSSGLSVSQRRTLLTQFLEARDLVFDGDASTEYRSHWGRPRSVQRLFRLASHIRWLIGWQGKSTSRAQANEDWRSDLQWLKKTYFKPNVHKFRWPGV